MIDRSSRTANNKATVLYHGIHRTLSSLRRIIVVIDLSSRTVKKKAIVPLHTKYWRFISTRSWTVKNKVYCTTS